MLLEPIMKVDIVVPEEYMGDFVADLQQRRAMITHTEARGRNTVIEAEAPLANLFGYSGAMRGLSQGRALGVALPVALRPRARRRAERLFVAEDGWVAPEKTNAGLDRIVSNPALSSRARCRASLQKPCSQ